MPHPGVASLLCRITPDALGALPLTYVREIMRSRPVAPAATSLAGLRGTVMIRGILTPVIEVATLLGGSVQPTRFVALTGGSRQVALAVEDVVGLIHVAHAAGQEVPLFDARVAPLAAIDPGLPGLLLTVRRVSTEDAAGTVAGGHGR